MRRRETAQHGKAPEASRLSTISHGREARTVSPGKTIFDYADDLAVEVPTSCKRTGRCHECVVEIGQGMAALNPRNEAESFLRDDYRLACQAVIERDDIDIAFSPLRRRPKILTLTGEKTDVEIDPSVTRRGDEVYCEGVAIDAYRGHLYGLAVDLGTTTVVIDLVDLETGRSIQVSGFENPQRFGGSDVMNRISYDAEPRNKGELQQAIATAINREILEMCQRHGFARRHIYEVVIAGNTTMRDLFFKLDVQSVGQRPYKSLIEHAYRAGERADTALTKSARGLDLRVHPKAKVYGLPLIGSHVGADAAADLVACDLMEGGDAIVLLDIGTNTEVVACHGGRMVAASCPAGPAFEGGLIKYGMPAYDGAIERIRLAPDGDRYDYHTIADAPPQGLCGSGLIDLLAEMRRHDVLTAKGVFTQDRKLFQQTIVPEYGITFSKEDASNLGQAKAANYCGQFIALRELGLDPADVERLYLAGGFANYIDVGNAVEIGLLAPVPEERIVKVGNAAVQGAREILLSLRKRRALERLVGGIEHIELETTPDFFELFVDGCQFKPMPTVLNA